MNWFTKFLCVIGLIVPGKSLRELGYPPHEELLSVGLTGRDFMERYVHGTKPKAWETVEQFADRVTGRFYADYPTLRKRSAV